MGTDFIIKNKPTKYILIYGVKGSGKTLLQYNMQTSFKIENKEIEPTQGYNYEEKELPNSDVVLGIIDVSGDPQQYEIVDIVLKNIEIEGIIFLVPLQNLYDLDKSKILLQKVISNNNLGSNIPLLIVFNENMTNKENLDWISVDNLQENLFPKNIQIETNISKVFSCKLNISKLLNKASEASRSFYQELDNFAKELN
jgi:hypothetical protein